MTVPYVYCVYRLDNYQIIAKNSSITMWDVTNIVANTERFYRHKDSSVLYIEFNCPYVETSQYIQEYKTRDVLREDSIVIYEVKAVLLFRFSCCSLHIFLFGWMCVCCVRRTCVFERHPADVQLLFFSSITCLISCFIVFMMSNNCVYGILMRVMCL